MPRFFYIASTQEGEIKKGLVEAPDRETLIKSLQKNDLVIISVEKKKQSKLQETLKSSFSQFGRIKIVDKILFAKHLSTLISGGVSLGEGLAILKKGSTNPKMKQVLDDLIKSSKAGRSLYSSLAEHPKIFDNLFCNMVKTGEEGGTLDENLKRLALELQKSYELKRKIKGVMIYPMVILIVTVSIAMLLTIFILPKLTGLFDSFQVELPLSTKIFLFIANSLQRYGIFIFGGIFGLIFGTIAFSKSKVGRPILHRIILSLPIFSRFSRNTNMAQFCRTLGTLLRSGLHILEAITITADSLNNVIYERTLKKAVAEVQKGVPISVILERESELFSPLATSIISIGEKIGKLDDTLIFVADFYEEEVDAATKNLSVIIEPLLMVVIGLTVGGMAIAIVTPIYKLSGGSAYGL